jgi:hypothetical protein
MVWERLNEEKSLAGTYFRHCVVTSPHDERGSYTGCGSNLVKKVEYKREA